MKALVIHGVRDLRYETIDDPCILSPDDIIIQTKLCGVCGTDIHLFNGKLSPPIRSEDASRTYCIGHETVGEVVEIGSGVRHRKVGEQVLLPASIGCGGCLFCTTGEIKKCVHGGVNVFGCGTDLGGCQSQAVRVPAGDVNAVPQPDGVSAEQAILLSDNLSTAYGAVVGADLRPGRSVVVIGLGPIGLMALELAIAMGASAAYGIDLVEERREQARVLGAIVLSGDGLVQQIAEITKGRMIDCVIEAAGSDAAMALAFDLVAVTGNISVLSVNSSMKLDIPIATRLNGLTLRINYTTEVSRHWPDLLPMLQHGRIRPERFITRRLPMSDGLRAYEELEARAPGTLKTILYPG